MTTEQSAPQPTGAPDRVARDWDGAYQKAETPWDTAMPSPHLVAFCESQRLAGRALEIGCGYGHNAIWLARQGISVVATDVSQTALERADQLARQAGLGSPPVFRAHDVLSGPLPDEEPFDFVFDRGVFHIHRSAEERQRFAQVVHDSLKPDGLWLTIAGNADEPSPAGMGPPTLSASELIQAIEPHFRLLQLSTIRMLIAGGHTPRAWRLVAARR
ncbi:MAG: class I SAM-dependent methyltransferase [Deltaproteobacteria bacterium]|nr:class I SAM-dependent methyltransferase [Deltaproteobacteria bacterium]